MFDQVLEIFDEAAKKVVLSIYPNYERIAADIKVLYPVKFHRTLNAFIDQSGNLIANLSLIHI